MQQLKNIIFQNLLNEPRTNDFKFGIRYKIHLFIFLKFKQLFCHRYVR